NRLYIQYVLDLDRSFIIYRGHGAIETARRREVDQRELSHAETVDLQGQNSIGDDSRGPPPYSAIRNRPAFKLDSRREAQEIRLPRIDQRSEQAAWHGERGEIRRSAGSGNHRCRRTIRYLDHYQGCVRCSCAPERSPRVCAYKVD